MTPPMPDPLPGERDAAEISRMLLWFKAQLPAHRLDEWYITVRPFPDPVVIEDTDTSCSHLLGVRGKDAKRVEGYGRCSRCGARFTIAAMGNATAFDDRRVAAVVDAMKRRVERDAERDGSCWGDVPKIRESSYGDPDT